MRLIDVDALNTRIEKCVGIDCLGLEPVMAIRDVKALISVMPTIDAIPVGWMIDQANDPERAPLYRRYAQMLTEEWQKEREVQDAKM